MERSIATRAAISRSLRAFWAQNRKKSRKGSPKDPPVLKRLRRVNVGTGTKFATAIAKRYGECSERLVFLGEEDRKTVQIVKNYGGSKILWLRAPY